MRFSEEPLTRNRFSYGGKSFASKRTVCSPSSSESVFAGMEGPIVLPSTASVATGTDENCTRYFFGAAGAGAAVGAGSGAAATAGADVGAAAGAAVGAAA